MKILYTFHVICFGAPLDNDRKDLETEGDEMLCAILYLEIQTKPGLTT